MISLHMTLDQVYCNIPGAYKAVAAPHLGMSDHISVNLIPAYKPLICRTRPTTRTVQVWTEEASSALQDCFECTDWEVFKEGTDLDGYTSSQKVGYKRRIEEHFENNNPHSMWRGIKTITDYKSTDQLVSHDSTLPDTLNTFYACFDTPGSRESVHLPLAGRTTSASSPAAAPTLTHLQLPNTYVRMLFVDFSSAFNTVIPDKLILKLHNLGLPSSLCHWIRDFLTNRPQVFADDTTIVGLISDNDETHYREEIQHLTQWCSNNKLVLNASKTKEVIVDYRRFRNEYGGDGVGEGLIVVVA
ncbi:hypothetical protein L3Q82_015114 [Scortum barcoo]|uniref:Uncharacterized protein n=1 Tax=Scortum barcoo TaxID=214431 RepID=A0ACB8VSX5_9TELE|nr:hypothetical protein L3Q82_015114 [Scortum barcoo]